MSDAPQRFPSIEPVGLSGLLVRFGDRLEEPANRAALAFRAAVERECPRGVEECATSLVSTFLRFDPLAVGFDALADAVRALLRGRDWYAAPLPEGRARLEIPTLYGTEAAPQLADAAQAAGLTEAEATAQLSRTTLRVHAIGFAPGQPYCGTLPEAWDIPRQTALTPRVPEGALVVAIRQLVLFSVSAPTGWRHVGQTRARLFRPESDAPFLLRPGDLVTFPSVPADAFARMAESGEDGITRSAL